MKGRNPACPFLNETPDNKYVVATDLGSDRIFAIHMVTKFKRICCFTI